MDGFSDEALRRNTQWAGCVRVSAFMLLMLSTLMIVRVEQFNNNDNVSVPQESPMGSAKRATARFQWQMAPFLKSNKNALTTVYLTSSEEFAAVFRSEGSDTKEDAINDDVATQLSFALSNVSYMESPLLRDEQLKRLVLSSSETHRGRSPPHTLSSQLWDPSSFSMTVDATPEKRSSVFFKHCFGHPRCYVSLALDQRDRSVCDLRMSGIENGSSLSWSCLTSTESVKLFPEASDSSASRLSYNKHCVGLYAAPNISSLKAAQSSGHRNSSLLHFCARPLQHLLATDLLGSRVFFIQRNTLEHDLDATDQPLQEVNNVALVNSSSATDDQNVFQTQQYLNYCVVVVELDSYNDLSNCFPIPIPSTVFVDVSRPPVYIHYNTSTSTLLIFYYDITDSLIVTVLDTLPVSKSLRVRFSTRLARLSSSWLILPRENEQGSVLLLGDKAPYLGVVHVLDLVSGSDVRLNSGLHRFRNTEKTLSIIYPSTFSLLSSQPYPHIRLLGTKFSCN